MDVVEYEKGFWIVGCPRWDMNSVSGTAVQECVVRCPGEVEDNTFCFGHACFRFAKHGM